MTRVPRCLLFPLFVVVTAAGCSEDHLVTARIAAPVVLDPDAYDDAIMPTEGHAGWTAGAAAVGDDGQATFTVPIRVPAGRNGIGPTLALEYSSRGGETVVGAGWTLTGLSRIQRCDARHFGDIGRRQREPDPNPIEDELDAEVLCLDGERLLRAGRAGFWGSGQYRRWRNGTSRIEYDEDRREFRVWERDGTIRTYGGSSNSRLDGGLYRYDSVSKSMELSADGIYGWLLSRVEDRHGNYMTVSYDRIVHPDHAVEVFPVQMRYTGHDSLGPGNRSVRFRYAARPADAVELVRWKRGFGRRISQRLVGVQTFAPGSPDMVSELSIDHDVSPQTRRLRVTSIADCDGNGVCREPLLFDYSGSAPVAAGTGAYETEIAAASDSRISTSDEPHLSALAPAWPVTEANNETTLFGRRQDGSWLAYRPGVWVDDIVDVSPDEFILPFDFNLDGISDVARVSLDAAGDLQLTGHLLTALTVGTDAGGGVVGTPAHTGQLEYHLEPAAFHISTYYTCGDVFASLSVLAGDIDGNGVSDFVFRCGSNVSAALHEADGSSWGAYANGGGPSVGDFITQQMVDMHGFGLHSTLSWWAGRGYRTAAYNERRDHAVVASGREVFMDINGDGLTDVVELDDALTMFRFNLGGGFGAPQRAFDPTDATLDVFTTHLSGRKAIDARVADLNVDGRDDLVLLVEGRGWCDDDSDLAGRDGWCDDKNVALAFLSTGAGFRGVEWGYGGQYQLDGDATERVGWPLTTIADVDGDNLLDLVYARRYPRCEGPWRPNCRPDGVLRTPLAIQPSLFVDNPDELLSVSTTRGHELYKFEYGWERGQATCDYPQSCVPEGVRVVERAVDALGRATAHDYVDPRADLHGEGFLGFARHYAVNEETGAVVERHFDNQTHDDHAGYWLARRPIREVRYVEIAPGSYRADDTAFTYNLTKLEDPVSAVVTRGHPSLYVWQAPHVVQPSTSSRYVYEGRLTPSCDPHCADVDLDGLTELGTTSVGYRYDERGALLERAVAGGGEVTTVRYEREHRPGRWLVGLPERVTTESVARVGRRNESQIRTVKNRFNGRGFLAGQTIEPDRPEALVEITYANDGFGQVAKITKSTAGLPARITRLERDADFIHPRRVTNPEGHVEQLVVQPGLGVVVAAADPNGGIATQTFDSFGRLRSRTLPAAPDAQTTVTYDSTGRGQLLTDQRVAGHAHQKMVHDHLGRAVRRRTRINGRWTTQDVAYDTQGRVENVRGPYGGAISSVRERTFDYDNLGRPRTIDHHDGHPNTSITYDGLTTMVTDRRGVTRTSTSDMLGRVVVSRQFDGTTPVELSYDYGPFGAIRRVTDGAGARWDTEYDDIGRVVYRRRPDSAPHFLSYNAYGELSAVRDNRDELLVEYQRRDRLGRGITKWTREDGTTKFRWDTAPNGVGRLAFAVATGPDDAQRVATQLEYDLAGRTTHVTQKTPTGAFAVSSSFDSYGRLSSMTYPKTSRGHLRVTYNYAPASQNSATIRSIDASDGGRLWKAGDFDGYGRLRSEAFGNGLEGTRTIDSLTGRITDLAVTGAVSQSYGYDANGNMTSRVDRMLESNETFGYDDLNRLESWRTNDGPLLEYDHDIHGNLILNAGAAQQFDPNVRNAHRLTHDSDGNRYSYDRWGRRTRGPNMRVTSYSSFGLPREMRRGGVDLTFTYDAFGQRVTKSTPNGDVDYVAHLYERRDSASGKRHQLRVFGDDGPVAEITVDDGSATRSIHYLHGDRQGSTVAVTNEAGAVVERSAYAPYGKRTVYDAGGAAVSSARSRGFTDHEYDDESGFINMNGRVFDPATASFLTPDPLVARPHRRDSYNAYGYVENQPFRFTDPTGYEPLCDGPCSGIDPVSFVTALGATLATADWSFGGGGSSRLPSRAERRDSARSYRRDHRMSGQSPQGSAGQNTPATAPAQADMSPRGSRAFTQSVGAARSIEATDSTPMDLLDLINALDPSAGAWLRLTDTEGDLMCGVTGPECAAVVPVELAPATESRPAPAPRARRPRPGVHRSPVSFGVSLSGLEAIGTGVLGGLNLQMFPWFDDYGNFDLNSSAYQFSGPVYGGGAGVGLDVNAAVGGGDWSGPFNVLGGSLGVFSGQVFSSPDGGWFGVSVGLGAGTPASLYGGQIHYRELVAPRLGPDD